MWEFLAMGAGMGLNILSDKVKSETQLEGMEAGIEIERFVP